MINNKNLENKAKYVLSKHNPKTLEDYTAYSLTAFILCGKSPADKIVKKEELEKIPANNKAFLKLGERPMVEYVIKAFLNSNKIKDIYIINHADEELTFRIELEKIIYSSEHRYPRIIRLLSFDDEDLINNIEKTFVESNLKDDEYAIIASSDTPMINPKLINDFVKQIYYFQGYDAYVPYTRISMLRAKYPKIKKRSMFELLIEENNEKKRDGVRTGNLFALKKETFIENKKLMEYLFESRKKGYLAIANDIVARLHNKKASMMFEYGKKLVRKELTIDDLSEIVRQTYDIYAKGILVEPEFCIDVDRKKDFEEIKNYL
ncbi:MAG: hypothetical protein ACP5OZ_02055 [Candidatus Woesearchaeota archaeon]